jgi:hypothetical protein
MTPDLNITEELKGLAPALVGQQSLQPYKVPVGYFEAFPQRMLDMARRDEASEEISSISPLLAGLSRKMPFTVPEGYFEQAAEQMELEPGSILAGIERHVPYVVPMGYFEEFPQAMLRQVYAQESLPTAKGASSADSNLRPVTGKESGSSSGASVISIGRSWIRYAAAAVVTALLALAGWMYFQPASDSIDTNPIAALQLDREFSQISDEEILEFTNPTSTIYYGTAVLAPGELSGSEVHDLLGDVSDEALQQYLQEFNGKHTNSMN